MTVEMNRRRYGLDLLKLICMGMIILHHILLHGGLLTGFHYASTSRKLFGLLNRFLFCAVNVYALISGYVLSRSSFRLSRLLELWLQVFFTGMMITAGFALFSSVPLTNQDWLRARLPVIKDEYWYFTAYFGLYMLSPALNHLLNTLPRRILSFSLAVLFFLFCIVPLFGVNPTLALERGYHIGWLMMLYLLGGWIRLYGCGRLRRFSLPVYVVCVLLTWRLRRFQEYTSPTVLLAAVALLVLFENFHLPRWLEKTVFALAPLTFGVYLLHDHPLIRVHFIMPFFRIFTYFSTLKLILLLPLGFGGLYAACLLLEFLRTKLFSLLRLPSLCQRIEKFLRKHLRLDATA